MRTITIVPDTYAALCYDSNTIEELREILRRGPDEFDMEVWGLTAEEWKQEVETALKAKIEERDDA